MSIPCFSEHFGQQPDNIWTKIAESEPTDTQHTLTKNPAILYQGVPLFGCFEGFPTHLDEKTAISLLRSTKATASRGESRGRHSFIIQILLMACSPAQT